MEKSVLFIDRDEWLYKEQLSRADFTAIGVPTFGEALLIRQQSEIIRKSIKLVFVDAQRPFAMRIFENYIMKFIPNAGVLFLREDPEIIIQHLKADFERLPTYVYGARKSATPFAIDEAIEIAFASKHHETAKANLKDWWGRYL